MAIRTGICDQCSKPFPDEAIADQAEAMKPRDPREGWALLAKTEAFLPVAHRPFPDIRMGDIVEIRLIAAAVPDITAGFYCECD